MADRLSLTEPQRRLLQDLADAPDIEMMLIGPQLRVAESLAALGLISQYLSLRRASLTDAGREALKEAARG